MNRFSSDLNYLCIEIIGKNIKRYCKLPNNQWRLRYSKELGEKILNSTISNSFYDGINEKSFKFIFSNFYIENVRFFPIIIKRIEYFDFLNNLKFNKFKLNSESPIKLRNRQNFSMEIDFLKIDFKCDKNLLEESYGFFSNVKVNKSIYIYMKFGDENTMEKLENIILILIENSSENLETLQIFTYRLTKNFIKKCIPVIKKRKNLKKLEGINISEFDESSIIDLYQSTFSNLTSFTIKNIQGNLNLKTINICLKYLYSIQQLKIFLTELKFLDNLDEIKSLFFTLKSRNNNNLTELLFQFINLINFGKEFSLFLQSCFNIQYFVFIEEKIRKIKDYNFFDSLSNSWKSLKYIHLELMWITTSKRSESLQNLLRFSSINEILLKKIYFKKERNFFLEMIRTIGIFKCNITSLQIIKCRIPENELKFFPNILKNLNSMKIFHLENDFLNLELFYSIIESLMSSGKTLVKIIIDKNNHNLRKERGLELYQLLEKCEHLNVFSLGISLFPNEIPKLFSILKKFRNKLEHINIHHFFYPEYQTELIDFLSSCTRLKSVSGSFSYDFSRSELISLVKSLENSKYTLESFPHCKPGYSEMFNKFPNFLSQSG